MFLLIWLVEEDLNHRFPCGETHLETGEFQQFLREYYEWHRSSRSPEYSSYIHLSFIPFYNFRFFPSLLRRNNEYIPIENSHAFHHFHISDRYLARLIFLSSQKPKNSSRDNNSLKYIPIHNILQFDTFIVVDKILYASIAFSRLQLIIWHCAVDVGCEVWSWKFEVPGTWITYYVVWLKKE